MAKVLLLETKKDSPISNILRSFGHSIIRIDLEEGEKKAFGPSKTDIVPDIILWDKDITSSPFHFLSAELTSEEKTEILQIVILESYNKNFLRSWVGGSHYGFLVRPVSEPAVISVVENALTHQLPKPNSPSRLEFSRSFFENPLENPSIGHLPSPSESFLSTVIDSLEMPFLVIDVETLEVRLANSAAMSRATGTNVHCYELSHGRSSPCTGNEHECPLGQIINTGAAYSTEHQHQRSTGEKQYVEVKCYPIKDAKGRVTHIIEYEIDITTQHLYQEQLESAKKAAEENTLAKSQFISNMSHELRTPLNIILGYSELLAQEEKDPSKQEKLSSVQRAGKNLLAMVNDILDFSEIEANRLELDHELFSLRDLITYQPSFFNQQLSSKQIKLETHIPEDMPYRFYGDQHRMHQIVTNLLSNAIKFTPAGRISLSCNYVEEQVVIEVADTGIGIAPDRYGKLFTPFEQIEGAPNRSYSGTGLGLVIVKSLVEKMNGDIQVESTPGEGSKFTVTLPLQPDPTNLAQEGVHNISSPKQVQNSQHASTEGKLHILVAEDNKVNQQLMRLILKNFGHTCDTAPEGKTALKYLQSQNYDLAIVDMHMPVMDGYQLVKEIRKNPKLQGLTVFSLSAATSREETDEFLKIGCNDFLHKPVDTHELHEKLNRLVNRGKLNETKSEKI